MEDGKHTWSIWVDWEKRIISFRKAEGFEALRFANREEMLTFAVEKSTAGFGIQ